MTAFERVMDFVLICAVGSFLFLTFQDWVFWTICPYKINSVIVHTGVFTILFFRMSHGFSCRKIMDDLDYRPRSIVALLSGLSAGVLAYMVYAIEQEKPQFLP